MASFKFLGSIIETKAILLQISLRECLVVTPFDISPIMLSRGWYLEALHSHGKSASVFISSM